MNKKELIFNYLLKNIDGDGKIKIQNVVLAKEFGFTTQTISNIMKSLESNSMISRDKKTITINKSKLVIDDLLTKRNLKYSKKEIELLEYIYSVYSKESYENGYEYVCITYKNMKDNTTIKKDTELNNYITKFINDGLLSKIDGDYKKHISNKYKFNLDILNNNEIEQQPQEINNNETETIELLMKSIDELIEEMTRMNERMDKMGKYCLALKEDNEKLHQRLNRLENNSTTPIRELVDNIVTDNSYHQQKVNLSTTERIAIYNKFKENKEKIIQHISDNLTQLEYADTLDDVLKRMNIHHDMNIIYNQIGNDIDGIFYLLPKLNDVDGNLLVYRYLTDKAFLQRLKSIISNI
jgi:DNA-binding Lrp family transcriptional regulator